LPPRNLVFDGRSRGVVEYFRSIRMKRVYKSMLKQ
jgi:hypothetical protein